MTTREVAFWSLATVGILAIKSGTLKGEQLNFSRRASSMHVHEEATIRAFIAPAKRDRWFHKLASPKHRKSFVGQLNHCHDIDDRYATPLASSADAMLALNTRGAPAVCHVISDAVAIDGLDLPLREAIEQAELEGWGTLISCVPGRLAYYIDEAGSQRRLLLERNDA